MCVWTLGNLEYLLGIQAFCLLKSQIIPTVCSNVCVYIYMYIFVCVQKTIVSLTGHNLNALQGNGYINRFRQ